MVRGYATARENLSLDTMNGTIAPAMLVDESQVMETKPCDCWATTVKTNNHGNALWD